MCSQPTRRRPNSPHARSLTPEQTRQGQGRATPARPEAAIARRGARPASPRRQKKGARASWHAPRRRQRGGYVVLLVVALLAAVVAVPGVALALPLASTALQAAGSCSSVSAGFGGAGGPGGPGGRCRSAIQSVSSLPQPSSLGGSGWASQFVLPLGQAMRMWK